MAWRAQSWDILAWGTSGGQIDDCQMSVRGRFAGHLGSYDCRSTACGQRPDFGGKGLPKVLQQAHVGAVKYRPDWRSIDGEVYHANVQQQCQHFHLAAVFMLSDPVPRSTCRRGSRQ